MVGEGGREYMYTRDIGCPVVSRSTLPGPVVGIISFRSISSSVKALLPGSGKGGKTRKGTVPPCSNLNATTSGGPRLNATRAERFTAVSGHVAMMSSGRWFLDEMKAKFRRDFISSSAANATNQQLPRYSRFWVGLRIFLGEPQLVVTFEDFLFFYYSFLLTRTIVSSIIFSSFIDRN